MLLLIIMMFDVYYVFFYFNLTIIVVQSLTQGSGNVFVFLTSGHARTDSYK